MSIEPHQKTHCGTMMSRHDCVGRRHRMHPVSIARIACCVLVGLCAVLWLPTDAMAAIHRYALVIGHNKGDHTVKDLQFAQRDANRISSVLQELGGFKKEHVKTLISPSLQQVRSTFKAVRQRLQKADKGGMFLFFYSGHSRSAHFLLGKERLPYREVTKFVQSLPVRVRLLLVDSCFSGQIAAAKGARRKDFINWSHKHLGDVSVQQLPLRIKGYAVLASSGASERSYESARLRSSFFTASLLLGLRGAADRNQDQKVSLAEVYAYARAQTILFAGQHKTKMQRPVFLWRIKGDAPLVLTHVKRAQAHLALSPQLRGYCLLYRGGVLVHEFNKPLNQRVVVGIRQGKYQIQIRRGRWIGIVNTTLVARKRRVVQANDLKWYRSKNQPGKGPWLSLLSHRRMGLMFHYAPIGVLSLHGLGLSLGVDVARWMRVGLRYQFALQNLDNHNYISHGIGLVVGMGYSWDIHYFRLWVGAQVEPRLSVRHNQSQSVFVNVGSVFQGSLQLDWTLSPEWSMRFLVAGGAHVVFFSQAMKWAPAFDAAIGFFWHFW